MTRALQTRQVGYTTHQSGHVMAPPDIVYEVEEAPARSRSPLWARIVYPPMILLLAWVFVRAVIYAIAGVELPFLPLPL